MACHPHFRLANDPQFRYPRAPGISWTPAQAFAAYGGQRLPGITRSGVIGIVELSGGEMRSDTAAAFSGWNLPAPNVTNVSVQGAQSSPGDAADGEVALDLQLAAAFYSLLTGKAATVRMYYAPNTDSGFASAVKQAADDGCDTFGVSWGSPERDWGSGLKGFSAALAYAASKRCAVFAASGDNGSGDGEPGNNVDYPAADPNAIGCGGTMKTPSAETVWANGGGGYSSVFPAQAWQIGAPNGGTGRLVPDLAGIADPQTGWQIHLNGAWTVIGGTSAVAPMYAGIFAGFAAALGGLPAQLGPLLYTRPACFGDITSGANGSYRAATGLDPCTGLGVPKIQALYEFLRTGTPTPPPNPPQPTPDPAPLLTVSVPRAIKKGGIVSFVPPVTVPAGTYDFTPTKKKAKYHARAKG
jgi:kumamolisin